MSEPEHEFDTRAITGGRRFSSPSLAPVIFPATAYEVEHVADHRKMGATCSTS